MEARTSDTGRAVAPRPPLQAEEPENPERTPATYATAYDALNRNRQFQVVKRNTKVALRGQVPRGVSSDHVCNRAFGDAFDRT